MTPEQKTEIFALRQKQLTPKQIARKLGLKPAQISAILKAEAEIISEKMVNSQELPPLAKCLINISGKERLLNKKNFDHGGMGLTSILVARIIGYNRFMICTYLIDYQCLGLKNTIGPKKVNEEQLNKFIEQMYQNFEEDYVEITIEEAQSIVFGAINYAEKLGFKPHRDFAETKSYLGEISQLIPLEFGHKGKPFYVSGPYDNTTQILQTLKANVGEGNYEYLLNFDEQSDFFRF